MENNNSHGGNMKTNTYLLKYGEIFLKGKNRFVFEDALVNRTIEAVAKIDGDFKVHKNLSRIYVEAQSDFDEDELTKDTNIECVSADGKSNIIKMLDGYKDKNVLVVADGAAFGSFIAKVLTLAETRKNIALYLPESFEWILLQSGVIPDKEIQKIFSIPLHHFRYGSTY